MKFSGSERFKYYQYRRGQVTSASISKLFGDLTLKETSVTFHRPEKSTNLTPEQQITKAKLTRKQSASQFHCEGIILQITIHCKRNLYCFQCLACLEMSLVDISFYKGPCK